jgi:hypothetical protein
MYHQWLEAEYSETSIHSFFVGGLENNYGFAKTIDAGAYKTGFVQGAQKLNDGSEKTIHPEIIGRGSTVRIGL